MRANFLRRPEGLAQYAADAVRLIGLLSVIAGAIWWAWTDAAILALALPALLVPRFVGVRAGFDIVYGVIVLVAAWSNVLGLYESIALWDLLVHFAATGVIAAMLYVALSRWGIVPGRGGEDFVRRAPLVLVPAFGLAISALWEMLEWIGFTFISEEIFVTYTDTIGDMAVGGLGAALAGIVVAFVRLDAPASQREDRAVSPGTTSGRTRRSG